MLFFYENMVIYVVNTEKVQIFSVRSRSFVHLNDSNVLFDLYVNNSSQGDHHI